MRGKELLTERIKQVEELIYPLLPEKEGYANILYEAMNYSVQAGGKRIRPILMKETFALFQNEKNTALPYFMAAIECIHTYSLVHDDLPSMDNDEFRRGKLTTHAKYGEAMGVLAGDGLLNYGYELIAKAMDEEQNNPYLAKAFFEIATKAGCFGMVKGQVIDVISEGDLTIDLDKLYCIHQLKTAALIEASMKTGAFLGKATPAEIMIVEEIAQNIGIAFQIQDDILDVTSTTEVLGKPVGSDEKNHKRTTVSIMGVKEATKEVKRRTEHALELLHSLPNQNPVLEQLLEYLVYREN